MSRPGQSGGKDVVDPDGLVELHLLRHHAVEDERQGGREEQSEAARGRDESQAEPLRVVGPPQRRVQQGAEGHDGDPGGAGEGREERAAAERHDGEAAAQPAQQRARGAHQAIRRPALTEYVAREGEQRDRDQRGHVDHAVDLDRHHGQVDLLAPEPQQRAGRDQGEERRAQQGEGDEQQDDDHAAPPSPWRASRRLDAKRSR
jgi:hypothetical protein